MKFQQIAEAGIGLYLIAPGAEDALTAGASLAPSAALGAALIAHAFGVLKW
jgi:hypothetical protein